jgi:hypothetical protein
MEHHAAQVLLGMSKGDRFFLRQPSKPKPCDESASVEVNCPQNAGSILGGIQQYNNKLSPSSPAGEHNVGLCAVQAPFAPDA